MPTYKVSNHRGVVQREVKPGFREFLFSPGETKEFTDQKLAESLVRDNPNLTLEVVPDKKVAVPPKK